MKVSCDRILNSSMIGVFRFRCVFIGIHHHFSITSSFGKSSAHGLTTHVNSSISVTRYEHCAPVFVCRPRGHLRVLCDGCKAIMFSAFGKLMDYILNVQPFCREKYLVTKFRSFLVSFKAQYLFYCVLCQCLFELVSMILLFPIIITDFVIRSAARSVIHLCQISQLYLVDQHFHHIRYY